MLVIFCRLFPEEAAKFSSLGTLLTIRSIRGLMYMGNRIVSQMGIPRQIIVCWFNRQDATTQWYNLDKISLVGVSEKTRHLRYYFRRLGNGVTWRISRFWVGPICLVSDMPWISANRYHDLRYLYKWEPIIYVAGNKGLAKSWFLGFRGSKIILSTEHITRRRKVG